MTGWQRFTKALPLALALTMTAAVWVAGAVWSFREQTRFAASRGFAVPQLLPLVLDGLAVSLAGVAYAAALDGRAAVQARLGTALAVAASAGSNGAWAWWRTGGDPGAVVLAAGVPIAANLAFEVLLGELRRQVHRRRGLPVPVAVPGPRLIRLALAPVATSREWRDHVLEITAPAVSGGRFMGPAAAASSMGAETTDDPVGVVMDTSAAPLPPVEAHVHAPAIARRTKVSAPRAKTTKVPLEDLLPVGQEIAEQLAGQGQRLSRRALQTEFRERGHSLSTGRATELLQRLNAA